MKRFVIGMTIAGFSLGQVPPASQGASLAGAAALRTVAVDPPLKEGQGVKREPFGTRRGDRG